MRLDWRSEWLGLSSWRVESKAPSGVRPRTPSYRAVAPPRGHFRAAVSTSSSCLATSAACAFASAACALISASVGSLVAAAGSAVCGSVGLARRPAVLTALGDSRKLWRPGLSLAGVRDCRRADRGPSRGERALSFSAGEKLSLVAIRARQFFGRIPVRVITYVLVGADKR